MMQLKLSLITDLYHGKIKQLKFSIRSSSITTLGRFCCFLNKRGLFSFRGSTCSIFFNLASSLCSCTCSVILHMWSIAIWILSYTYHFLPLYTMLYDYVDWYYSSNIAFQTLSSQKVYGQGVIKSQSDRKGTDRIFFDSSQPNFLLIST